MDPLELLKPSMPPARKLLVETFVFAHGYESFIDRNPYIEPISLIVFDGKLVLTYKEPF
jgi:hypothetical protein